MIKTATSSLSKINLFDLTLMMSLLIFVFYVKDWWYLTLPLSMVSILTLLIRPMRMEPKTWFLMSCIMASSFFYHWFSIDNHKYLTLYWCFSIFLCLLKPTPKESENLIAFYGQFFLAACMYFAVLWKTISIDYLNGDFFKFSVLTDSRFDHFAAFISGLELSDFSQNRDLLRDIWKNDPGEAIQLISNSKIDGLAHFLTWWTIIIEFVLAVLFSLKRNKLVLLKHSILILFIISTYSIATVGGFAWLLIVFACTQLFKEKHRGAYLLVYIILFSMIEIFKMPFGPALEVNNLLMN